MKKNYKSKKIIISSIIVILSLLLLYSTVKIIKWMDMEYVMIAMEI